MRRDISKLYHPNPAMCCERCAFGRGRHTAFCESLVAELGRIMNQALREFQRNEARVREQYRRGAMGIGTGFEWFVKNVI